jgi:4-hydroxybenzoate polyprenyltransferase
LADIWHRAPLSVFWLWINLLPFTIGNQRQPDSIAEDGLNKPWRTMPSKRMTPSQARTLMLFLYPLALVTSLQIGGLWQCLSLMALGFWYNDLRGGDRSCVIRNLINACGFNRFTTGALEVLLVGTQHPPTSALICWQLLISAIIFTTVQTQDMYDQLGDGLRGRRTVPLVFGDALGRWSIVVPMAFWCLFCPWYIGSPPAGFAISVGLGGLVAARALVLKSVPADKMTFRLWNLWMATVYALPLLKVMHGRM